MSELKFKFEWIDPAGARGPELRATWATFQLLVDGESITRPLDDVSKTVRDSVFVPLYPLAEWLATHWWFLLNELETPNTNEESYASRHDLRFAGEGFAIPSVTFKPFGSTILLEWRRKEYPLQRIEFVSQGTAYVAFDEFENVFSHFISSVVSRLTHVGITDTLLQDEWKAILEAGSEEKEFCQASASLGMDPYALSEETTSTIVRVGNELPKSLVGEFFRAADFPHLNEQLRNVLEALELSRSNPVNLEPLKQLRKATQTRVKISGMPWEQGYQVARELRQELNLDGKVLRAFDDVSQALGVNDKDLNEAIRRIDHSITFDAVVDVNNTDSPGFVISHKKEGALKFSFCRGLFEFLFANQNEPLLVTKTRSDRQKRNRAFASEFLLPADALRKRITTSYVGEEIVEDLAAEFGVSTYVVEHQLENHRIAKTIPLRNS